MLLSLAAGSALAGDSSAPGPVAQAPAGVPAQPGPGGAGTPTRSGAGTGGQTGGPGTAGATGATGAAGGGNAGSGPGTGREPGTVVTVLSLDEAVQRALGQNPTLEQSAAAVRRAEGVVAEARSFRLPRLDANAQFTVQGPIPSFTINQPPATPGGAPTPQTITLGRTFTRNISLSATYDPDPFGRLRLRRTVAQRQVNVTLGGYYTQQNELVYAVQNVYLAALRAQELVQVQQEAIAAAQEQLRVATAQFRAGTAPEFDVLRARVQVENVRQSSATAGANLRRTRTSLAELLSLDPLSTVELVPVGLPPEPDAVAIGTARSLLDPSPGTGPAPLPGNIEAALAESFNRRPEVYRAAWQRRAAQAQVSLERRGLYPSLGFSASGFYNPDATGFAAITKSWSIVANVSIPIWDAGLTRARVRQARADVDSASAQLDAARDSVTQEVKAALVDLEDASQRRQTASANVVQAREALRIARVRYTAGLAPNVEVTDAEAALTQARANEVNAAYDYLSALASLNRSLGIYASSALTTPRRRDGQETAAGGR